MSNTEQMATTEQVAEFLQMDAGTLRKWRMRGIGPTSYLIGNKARYDMTEVRRWVGMTAHPQAESAQALDRVLVRLMGTDMTKWEAAMWLQQEAPNWSYAINRIFEECTHDTFEITEDDSRACVGCGVTLKMCDELEIEVPTLLV